MTTKQTYIYSDAECVLHWMKDHPGDYIKYVNKYRTEDDYNHVIEKAKQTAVKFADQHEAFNAIVHHHYKKHGTVIAPLPNTIYTIEGYEVGEKDCSYNYAGLCFIGQGKVSKTCEIGTCKNKTATLKRIEDTAGESSEDGWIKVNTHADLPTKDCRYWIANKNGVFDFWSDKEQIRRKFENGTLTHYMELIEPKPPKH